MFKTFGTFIYSLWSREIESSWWNNKSLVVRPNRRINRPIENWSVQANTFVQPIYFSTGWPVGCLILVKSQLVDRNAHLVSRSKRLILNTETIQSLFNPISRSTSEMDQFSCFCFSSWFSFSKRFDILNQFKMVKRDIKFNFREQDR